MGARHAQPDACGVRSLYRRVVFADAIRQCRTLDGAVDLSADARRAAGVALSGTGAGIIPANPGKSHAGQSSAVIVAASAPTISDSESPPVRSKVYARSVFMLSSRPSPL